MKIATWNVNSIRARLPRLLEWLQDRAPEVILLQELKCLDDAFPTSELSALGYHAAVFGQRTYNGVAILAREPLQEVHKGLPDDGADNEARVIAATAFGMRFINVYVVNGQRVGTPTYHYKLQWMERLRRHLATVGLSRPVLLAGDFNVTFDDRDVYDPALFQGRIQCSAPERAALGAICNLGFTDAFRRFHEEGGHYTWWDYRIGGFRRGLGMRIDHVLLSEPAMSRCVSVDIDKAARGGLKPSDHAPVVATFAPATL